MAPLTPPSEGDAAGLRPPAGIRRRRASSRKGARRRPLPPAGTQSAEELAQSLGVLGAQDGANLDIRSAVHGVTHRGTVRIKLTHIESLTDTMLDQWRFLCTAQGYLPSVAFDAATNEAVVSCTPIRTPARCAACPACPACPGAGGACGTARASLGGACARGCLRGRPAASTVVFACLFGMNVLRHAYYWWSS